MAGYSIFDGTIADMTWQEVEKAGDSHLPILVPVAVVEQHGPHLPIATDIYGAYLLCRKIKEALVEEDVEIMIAPPYYFGMNPSTWMFAGSVNVSHDAMVKILTELLIEYARFGFVQQFIVNHHGDPSHNDAIVGAIAAARQNGVDAVLTLGGFVGHVVEDVYTSAHGHPFPLPEAAILRSQESTRTREARLRLTRSSLGVHAEERETSLIMRWFPDVVAGGVHIEDLPPVLPSQEQVAAAIQRGKWREISPLGYLGDPSVATEENGELYALEAADTAAAIKHRLSKSSER
jgi:creatinine amidohydrolase